MDEQWNKRQIEQIIKEKEFQFVYSDRQVQAYYNQKKYAIVKHSKNLKELVQEKKLPINNEISNLKKGHYYIIDIVKEEVKIKSRTQITYIAYALNRDYVNGERTDTFGNTIYQINITNLVNGTSRPMDYPRERVRNINDLTGKNIMVESVQEWDEETQSKQIIWTTAQPIVTPEEKEQFGYLLQPKTEEEYMRQQAEEDAELEELEKELLLEQEMEEAYNEQDQYDEFDFFDEYD